MFSPPACPATPADVFSAQVVKHRERADTVAVRSTLLPQTFNFSMNAPFVFLFSARDPRDRPKPTRPRGNESTSRCWRSASSLSVIARRACWLTSMLAGSTTRLKIFWALADRCSQKPSRPAS